MSRKDRILVTRTIPDLVLDQLEAVGTVQLWAENRAIPDDVLAAWVSDTDALYSMLTDRIDARLLDRAPGLRVISQMAVGVNNIDLAACTQRGIPVGHTPDVLNETTADTAFGLLLAAARRFGEGAAYVKAGQWRQWEPDLLEGSDVHHSTLGIIGLGRIGRAVARRAKGFDMEIIYHNRHRDRAAEDELGARYRSFVDLLSEADHVVILTPLTEQTRGMIDADALAKMKPGATLVNAARGPIVDSDALYDALNTGTIAAAGLDVTDPEPMPVDHPLLELPNCFIIPHLGSASVGTRLAMADLAARNLRLGLAGQRLEACANPEVYESGNSQELGAP